MMLTTKGIVSKFAELPEDQRQDLVADALQATAGMSWPPSPSETRGARSRIVPANVCFLSAKRMFGLTHNEIRF